MTPPQGRRAGTPAGARRVSARPLVRAASRPLPSVDRLRAASRPARRSGRRPPLRRRTAAAGRQPFISGRTLLLVGLVLLLALTLTGPVRQWLAGRADIAELSAEGSRLDARMRALRDQLEEQAAPGYTARQARERLTYVLPGDRLVVVVDGRAVAGDAGTVSATARPKAQPPWYAGLMQSVASADGDPPK